MAVAKVAMAVLMAFMLVAASHAEATVTCDQVTIWLTPCISYALMGGSVSPLCCQGVYSLIEAKKTADDRRVSCQRIKDKTAKIPGINYERTNEIPGKCGTTCPYNIYPSTDCSKVN